MLKGWIERVWVNGVAWELPAGANRLRGRLRNVRRIVAITSHGSSKLINALEGEVGKRMVTRTLRSLCHPLTRTTWLAFYGIDTATDEQRRAVPRQGRAEAVMTSARLRRLREELAEVGLDVDPESDWGALVLTELDYALRPRVHERRVPSVGSILEPTTPRGVLGARHPAEGHEASGGVDAAARVPGCSPTGWRAG